MSDGRLSLPRGRAALALALTLSFATACGPERLEKTEADLTAAISAAEARGDTATVRLFIEVPFAFDRVYIAGPRTPAATLAAALGDAWDPMYAREIETSDHFHLLVFDVGGKLYPAALPRRVAEIAPELTGRMYDPATAVFRVVRQPGSAAPTLLPQ